jgi:hypothetical protein
VSPLSPVKKHYSRNTSVKGAIKQSCEFKIGNRIRYIGTNPNLLEQYAGILAIFEVSGETYTCLKPDSKLTSWIKLED